MYKQYSICLFLFISYILNYTNISIAQSNAMQASFQKDTIIVEDFKRIHKNILTITHTKEEKIKIVFSTSDTDRISIMLTKTIDTAIPKNNTSYFTVYYTLFEKTNKEWSNITASIYNANNQLLKQCTFKVHIFQISKWTAWSPTDKPYYILPTTDTQELIIHLYNEGNINEKLKATLGSSANRNWNDSILLPPKKNMVWLLKIPIKYLIKKWAKTATPVIIIGSEAGKVFKIPINIVVPSYTYIEKPQVSNQDVFLQTEVSQTWRNKNPQTNFAVNGKIKLDSSSYLNLQYRKFTLTQFQYTGLPTTFASISFHLKNSFLYVGNILEANDFFIEGFGLKFKQEYESSGFAFTLSKDRTKDAYFTNWQWRRSINKNISLTPQITTYDNVDTRTKSAIPKVELQWKDSNNMEIKLFVGGSHERIQKIKLDTTLLSSMRGYSFTKKWKHLSIQSSIIHYGKDFAGGNQGLNQHMHNITYFQKPFTLTMFYTSNDKNFLYANDSAIYLLQGVVSNEVGASVSWMKKQISWQFQPSVFTQYVRDESGIRSNIYQITYNNRWYRGSKSFVISGNIGVNEITQQYTSYNYVHNIRASLNYNKTQLVLEWNKGPYYYYDTKDYMSSHNRINRLYILLQQNWQLPSTNFFMQSYASLQYNKSTDDKNISLSHYVQYMLPNWNGEIGLLLQWNSAFKTNNTVQLRFRKNWINSIKSLFKGKKIITLYKDKNGNRTLDNNESVLAYKPVWINEQLLLTNAKGQVGIKSYKTANYNINLNDVEASSTEWAPTNGYEQQITNNKNINIAFQSNGKLEGHIEVTKAKFAVKAVKLDEIKIYLTNEANHFTTVVDKNGRFNLSLPYGTYNIVIDEYTLEGNLTVTSMPQSITITSREPANVFIKLKQKERGIKVNK